MTYTLYKIIFPNGKIYIGYTSKELKKRQQGHKYDAKSKKLDRTPVMNALLKFEGKEIWEVLAFCSSIEEAHIAEIAFIAAYDSTNINIGYNVSRGGDGVKHTLYTKTKISKGAVITNKRRFANEKKYY